MYVHCISWLNLFHIVTCEYHGSFSGVVDDLMTTIKSFMLYVVLLYLTQLTYKYAMRQLRNNLSCKLSTKPVLTLRGVCKHSYLGKKSETSNRAL